MSLCALCRREVTVASCLGVCGDCIRRCFSEARPYVEAAHAASRSAFGLPKAPPQDKGGVPCGGCANACVIGEGRRGYCGLRTVGGGRLSVLAGNPEGGLLRWYRDPLPTNCVADWVCGGHDRRGFHNLAVFYAACTADCLFCQNWHYREMSPDNAARIGASDLAAVADERTFCVCFFGGDPAAQMPHALAVSRSLAPRGVRVCWETNGMMERSLLDEALEFSLRTGGCMKFDLKAFDEGLHRALTGVSNRRTLENFARAAARCRERAALPLVVASTLLVPGYVDAEEVAAIARFIASLDPSIPYALLAFAPQFFMADLPRTSLRLAREAEAAARAAGLANVRLANCHLLWE
ncbi:MAG TPA: radical SAM protein [Syntrophales bacterium]|nr:radical SAM protein [Syntrophales bacterium]